MDDGEPNRDIIQCERNVGHADVLFSSLSPSTSTRHGGIINTLNTVGKVSFLTPFSEFILSNSLCVCEQTITSLFVMFRTDSLLVENKREGSRFLVSVCWMRWSSVGVTVEQDVNVEAAGLI